MKIAICDDDSYFCSELENSILKCKYAYTTPAEIEVFLNSNELIIALKNGMNYDVIFLDIEVDHLTGIDIGKFIRSELNDYVSKIVYVSSKTQYDRQLFSVQPFDFLPKPINIEKLATILTTIEKAAGVDKLTFSFSVHNKINLVFVKDILYFEVINRKIQINCVNKTYVYYGKLSEVINTLAGQDFIQVHRSYFVNYAHILEIQYNQITMSNNVTVPISRNRYKDVMDFHMAFVGEKYNG